VVYAIGYATVLTFIPWLIDVVLLLRVLVIYPPHTITRTKFAILVVPPIALKVARVVVFLVWVHQYLHDFRGKTHLAGTGDLTRKGLWGLDIASWVLAAVDNGYAYLICFNVLELTKCCSYVSRPGLSTMRSLKY
jgi:hypothetical protein